MQVSLTTSGFEDFARRLEQAGPDVQRRSALELEASAFDYQNTVREKTPVDTGLLRGGWQIRKVSEREQEVFNATVYGPRINYGFSGADSLGRVYSQPGVFMLERAADEVRPRFIEGQRRALEGALS